MTYLYCELYFYTENKYHTIPVLLATDLRTPGGAIPARTYRMSTFVGRRHPVMHLQLSLREASTFFAWDDLSHTGQAYSATEFTKMSCGIHVVFLWYYIIPQKIPQGWRGTTHIHVVLQRCSLWYPCGTKNTIGNTTEKNYTTKRPYSSAVVFIWYSVIPQGWKGPHRFLWYCRGVACGTHVVKKYHRKYHRENIYHRNIIQQCCGIYVVQCNNTRL